MTNISVFIIDDDEDWIKSTIQFLEFSEDIRVVGYALDNANAVQTLTEISPDIILLDNNFGGSISEGVDMIQELKKVASAKIIMLTSLHNKELVINAINNGAVNYILKDNFSELPSHIRSTAKGCSPFEFISSEYRHIRTENKLSVLSDSEMELFRLLELGYNKDQICKKLCKSSSTIKNQITSMLKKLGVSSTKEALEKYKS